MAQEKTRHRAPAASETPEQMAAANKSLADALRMSFRLLSAIMIAIVVALLLTGLGQIQPHEVGIKLRFGRIMGSGDGRVLDQGLCWAWPEPIGRVEKISTILRELEINDFWMREGASDVGKDLSKRRAPTGGLRPIYDGALLTGDRGQVHAKLTCWYGFRKRGVAEMDPDAVIASLYLDSADEIVRAAVCSATIHATAKSTVEMITSKSHDKYVQDIFKRAQQRLDDLACGLRIDRVLLEKASVPLAAVGAFDAVNQARQDSSAQISKARGQAAKILREAAGPKWKELVGDLEEPGLLDSYDLARQTNNAPAARRLLGEMEAAGLLGLYPQALKQGPGEAADRLLAEVGRYGLRHLRDRAKRAKKDEAAKALDGEIERVGLIPLYARAREGGDEKLAGGLLAEINTMLLSHQTKGQAAALIEEARGYEARISERVKARAETFKRLLPKFLRYPDLTLSRLWMDVKQDVLTSPTNVKYYVTPGRKTVLQINDPEIQRELEAEMLKQTEQRDQQPPRRRGGPPRR